MATTHKQSPQGIARQVLKSNQLELKVHGLASHHQLEEHIESLIMLGIAAYTDPSNQRPENLSEACARLGINLHWRPRQDIPMLNRSDRVAQRDRYALFFGHLTPISTHSHEEPLIIEMETLHEQYPEVKMWVEAVY